MKVTIVPIPDGPLMINSRCRIVDADGHILALKAPAALCRCGASARKPFCDGSHKAVGFSSQPGEEQLRDQPIEYTAQLDGDSVTVSYTPVLCSHAGECQRLAPKVFDPRRKPWVDPSLGDQDDIFTVVAACPSGALQVSVNGAAPDHFPTDAETLKIERNGPYRVSNMTVEAAFETEGATESKYVLCRCGHSKNKPFCDGTHYDKGWKDDE
ncbi:MAG: CDGSH iron-sulfur domain-containing protein [Pseudomonadota bacterium]